MHATCTATRTAAAAAAAAASLQHGGCARPPLVAAPHAPCRLCQRRWTEEKTLRVWTPPGYSQQAAPPGGWPLLVLCDGSNKFEDHLAHQARRRGGGAGPASGATSGLYATVFFSRKNWGGTGSRCWGWWRRMGPLAMNRRGLRRLPGPFLGVPLQRPPPPPTPNPTSPHPQLCRATPGTWATAPRG